MTDSEAEVSQRCRLLGSQAYGANLMRNNSGAFTNDEGRLVRFGLGNDSAKLNKIFKSSDLIGPTPVLITPAMIGRTMAIFTAAEIKQEGWVYGGTARETAQRSFLHHITALGGIATFAQHPDDLNNAYQRFLYP